MRRGKGKGKDGGKGKAGGNGVSRGTYEVGYGKPPERTKFKPGQSGYPKGRPKGSRNRIRPAIEDNLLRAIINDEANQMITVADAKGRKTKITSTRGVVRAIKFNALKGQQRSQKLWVQLVSENERLAVEERREVFEAAAKYKQDWGPRFKGANPPNHFPHPDDVKLDIDTGTVKFAGPVTEDEVPTWKRWKKIRAAIRAEQALLTGCQDDPDYADCKDKFETLIKAAARALWTIDLALGGAREVMKFLERADVPNFGKLEPVRKRLPQRREFVFAIVYWALQRQYEAER